MVSVWSGEADAWPGHFRYSSPTSPVNQPVVSTLAAIRSPVSSEPGTAIHPPRATASGRRIHRVVGYTAARRSRRQSTASSSGQCWRRPRPRWTGSFQHGMLDSHADSRSVGPKSCVKIDLQACDLGGPSGGPGEPLSRGPTPAGDGGRLAERLRASCRPHRTSIPRPSSATRPGHPALVWVADQPPPTERPSYA